MMKSEDTLSFARLKSPLIMMISFWVIAVVLWQTTGKIFYLFNFVYLGTALGIGIGAYEVLPKRKKLWGRRLAQFLVGIYMLVFFGLFDRENMQMEGFFFIHPGRFLYRLSHSLSGGQNGRPDLVQSGFLKLGLLDSDGIGLVTL